MSSTIVPFMKMDFNKLSLTEKKKNSYNGYTIGILYDGVVPHFVFPKMNAPFGISKWVDKSSGRTSFSISTSTDNKDFIEQCRKFDEFIFNAAMENFDSWFTKKVLKKGVTKESYLRSNFSSMLKYSTDAEGNILDYPPRTKATIYSRDDGTFNSVFYNSQNDQVNITTDNYTNYITTPCNVQTARRASKIWITPSGFGVTWVLSQLRFYPSSQLTSCIFDVEEETINNKENNDEIIEDEENEEYESEASGETYRVQK